MTELEYDLTIYPDPVLRVRAAEVTVFDDALDSLLGARGPADRLLGYAPAISGGVYYVPPRLPGPMTR